MVFYHGEQVEMGCSRMKGFSGGFSKPIPLSGISCKPEEDIPGIRENVWQECNRHISQEHGGKGNVSAPMVLDC